MWQGSREKGKDNALGPLGQVGTFWVACANAPTPPSVPRPEEAAL